MDDIDLSGDHACASHLVRMRCVRYGKIAFLGWQPVAG
jgi:hypothetical protein